MDVKWTMDIKKGLRFHVTPCFIWGWRSLKMFLNILILLNIYQFNFHWYT